MKGLDIGSYYGLPFFLFCFLVSNDAFDLLNQQNGGCKWLLVNHISYNNMFAHVCIVVHFPNSAIWLQFIY